MEIRSYQLPCWATAKSYPPAEINKTRSPGLLGSLQPLWPHLLALCTQHTPETVSFCWCCNSVVLEVWSRSISITWEVGKNANSWVTPRSTESELRGRSPATCVLTSLSSDSVACWHLQTTALILQAHLRLRIFVAASPFGAFLPGVFAHLSDIIWYFSSSERPSLISYLKWASQLLLIAIYAITFYFLHRTTWKYLACLVTC